MVSEEEKDNLADVVVARVMQLFWKEGFTPDFTDTY